MLRVFNNGIGMALIVPESEVEDIVLRLEGLKQRAFIIGEIQKRVKGEGSITFIR